MTERRQNEARISAAKAIIKIAQSSLPPEYPGFASILDDIDHALDGDHLFVRNALEGEADDA